MLLPKGGRYINVPLGSLALRRTHFWTCTYMDLRMNAETSCRKDAVSWSNIECFYMPFLYFILIVSIFSYFVHSLLYFLPFTAGKRVLACYSSFFQGLQYLKNQDQSELSLVSSPLRRLIGLLEVGLGDGTTVRLVACQPCVRGTGIATQRCQCHLKFSHKTARGNSLCTIAFDRI